MKVFGLTVLLLLFSFQTAFAANSAEWGEVEKILGRKGTVQDDVFKVCFPRTDLKIDIGNIPVEPAFDLTSWAAFRKLEDRTIMVGDLVLTVTEIVPVLKKISAENIEVTALHNHLIGTSQEVMYLHFSCSGDAVKMARALKSVLSTTATPISSQSSAGPRVHSHQFSAVQSVLGPGKESGRVLKYVFPRAEKVTADGTDLPPSMGTAVSINFESADQELAVTGELALTAEELNPVIRALTEGGIAVTAVHNHFLSETPRLFFLHFWGHDKPAVLAKRINAVLDLVNISRTNWKAVIQGAAPGKNRENSPSIDGGIPVPDNTHHEEKRERNSENQAR